MKAELNDQLSDRQTCRQESSELTRANRKLFRYITKYQNCEKKKTEEKKTKKFHFNNKKITHMGQKLQRLSYQQTFSQNPLN